MQLNIYYEKMIKSHGRLKGICFFFLVYSHRVLEKIYIYIIKLCAPVDKSVIVFRSMPDFSDNARALAEYMVEKGYNKKYKIFFDVSKRKKNEIRNGEITCISSRARYGRFKLSSIHRLFTAGYLMSTHEMIIVKQEARESQLLVRLWHGCGYKDRSQQDGKVKNFDVALVPGKLFVKPKAYFWNVDEKCILPLGYPRYDWLRMKDPAAQVLLESFKKNQDSKIVLWMPTFRIDKRGKCTESNSITQFPLMDHNSKWKDLDRLCIESNIVLIVKLHPFQTEYEIPFDHFSNIKKMDNQVFENTDIPMYKFVALTDALITDYSSIAIDYLIVNRPIAFALDDYEEYKNTRGFVFEDPRVYMPGHHLYKFEDLKAFLLDIARGNDRYKGKREQVHNKGLCNSDNYCESILERLGIEK